MSGMFLIHPYIYEGINVIFSPHKHLPLHPPSLIFSINQIYDLTKVNCFRSIPYLAGNLVYVYGENLSQTTVYRSALWSCAIGMSFLP